MSLLQHSACQLLHVRQVPCMQAYMPGVPACHACFLTVVSCAPAAAAAARKAVHELQEEARSEMPDLDLEAALAELVAAEQAVQSSPSTEVWCSLHWWPLHAQVQVVLLAGTQHVWLHPCPLQPRSVQTRSCLCSSICLQACYVETLIKWEAHQAIGLQKAGVSLVLPGAVGVQVHATASDGKAVDRLKLEIAKYEQKLGIGLGG